MRGATRGAMPTRPNELTLVFRDQNSSRPIVKARGVTASGSQEIAQLQKVSCPGETTLTFHNQSDARYIPRIYASPPNNTS
ncbi:hypothetical protein LF1_02580 [Rubripirellula obstinata]|uniref:Uncharacterized protein n=1 Tax=Rubripirellula obstinata TaxID=406547 RepID=A0A5B1C9E2_9BACT|nr:hypothetical protein LF1_02580 [Rubripirellula obstinata]